MSARLTLLVLSSTTHNDTYTTHNAQHITVQDMRISVIIPSYKPGDYIWHCLESLRHQTLAKDAFDVTIVLNGCGEPYLSLLKEGIGRYSELTVRLLHTEQGGVSNARNLGLGASEGEFVCFVDDDDWVSPTYLEHLLTGAGAGRIVAANVWDSEETTGQLRPDYITKAYEGLKPKGTVGLVEGRSFMSSSCCKLIPRELIGTTRFDTRFALSEDALFMAALSHRVREIRLASEDCIYYRRVRQTSASQASRLQRLQKSARVACAFAALFLAHPFRYNPLFFSTRILASLRKGLQRSWNN